VPQRRDRRWLWQQRTGKGETVRQERTARWATKAARQTPPGARPNRDGAPEQSGRAGTGPVIRVGCWRRRATAVREEWSPRGFMALDRTRLTGGVIASQPGQVATHSVAPGLGQDRPASENGGPQAAVFDSSDGVAPPRTSFLLPGHTQRTRRLGRRPRPQTQTSAPAARTHPQPLPQAGGEQSPTPQ